MEQINNIQVGNQIYQIGGTGSGSTTGGGASGGLTMGNQTSLTTLEDETMPFVFARTNTFSSIDCSYASPGLGCVIAGLPQDFMGESGELWSFDAFLPIVVSHNSTDIEGHPHKACVSLLQAKEALVDDSLSQTVFTYLQRDNSVNAIIKFHSTSKFLELTESDSIFIEYCLGAGMSIFTEQLPAEYVLQIAAMIQQYYSAGYLITGSKLITACVDGIVVNIALDITGDETSGYSAQLGPNTLSINSLEPGSAIFVQGQFVGFLIDIRDNQVEAAAEVPNYVFGVYNPADEALITNIPVWWDNDTPPTFAGEDTMVKISLFGWIGSYTTVHVPIDEILENPLQ